MNSNYDENYAHFKAVAESGDPVLLQEAVNRFGFENTRYESDLHFLEKCFSIANVCESIRAGVQLYCSSLGSRIHYGRMNVSLMAMNAAVELAQGDYDLTVGVAQGGSILPLLMHCLVGKATFVKNSPDGAKMHWFAPGREFRRPDQAPRILVCEDDALTGKTLKKVRETVAQLNPETVDVCFLQDTPTLSLDGMHSSAVVAQKVGGYDRAFYAGDVSFSSFVSNLDTLNQAVLKSTSAMKRKRLWP